MYVPAALRPWLGGRELLTARERTAGTTAPPSGWSPPTSTARCCARDGTVSDRTRAALAAANAAGLLVAFVTGRPPRWLDDVIERDRPHRRRRRRQRRRALRHGRPAPASPSHDAGARADARASRDGCARRSRASASPSSTATASPPSRTTCTTGQINPRLDRHGNADPRRRWSATWTTITATPGIKLLAKDRGADADEPRWPRPSELRRRAGAAITHSSSFGLLEIAAARRHQGHRAGRARRDARRRPRARSLAIGDMPNDVPMLEWAGHSYAVGNAHPAARGGRGAVVGTQRRRRRRGADRVDPRGLVRRRYQRRPVDLAAGGLGQLVDEPDAPRVLVRRRLGPHVLLQFAGQLGPAGERRPAATTAAPTTCPRASSGTPSTAHSRTAGCDAASTRPRPARCGSPS